MDTRFPPQSTFTLYTKFTSLYPWYHSMPEVRTLLNAKRNLLPKTAQWTCHEAPTMSSSS